MLRIQVLHLRRAQPMDKFKRIEFDDKPLLEAYIRPCRLRSCNLSLAHLLTWPAYASVEWAVIDSFLVIRITEEGSDEPYLLQPVGEGDYTELLPTLEATMRHECGAPLRLRLFGEQPCDLRALGYALYEERAEAEYIYATEDLRTLPGRKYQAKRNHLSNFCAAYDYRYEPLAPHHFEECLTLDARWRAAHAADSHTPFMRHDRLATEAAFASWERLGLQGGALYADGQLAAFTYGAPINHDTFDIIMEKGDTSYNGVFAAINKFFAADIECRYINREEDMGLEGLRRSKRSYNPTTILPVSHALRLDERMAGCRELWREVFGDELSCIDQFLINHYQGENMLSVEEQGRLLSMLHIVPFECNGARIGYIYAVATTPSARRRGYATRLLHEAIDYARHNGYDALALIPADEGLRDYYARFGFEGAQTAYFASADNFDFGTGEAEHDKLAILPLSDALKKIEQQELLLLKR